MDSLESHADPLLAALGSPDAKISTVLSDLERYQPQIIFTRIERSDEGLKISTSSLNLDAGRYFYPASTLKLPMAILAVEKLNTLSKGDLSLNLDTPYELKGHDLEAIYPEASERFSTLALDVEKIAVVSDNWAFNRLYDFVGPDAFDQRLLDLGVGASRAAHRLGISLPAELNRTQLGFKFEGGLEIEGRFLGIRDFGPSETLGRGYISQGKFVEEPFPIHRRNAVTLQALHGLLQRLIVPESFPASERFNLSEGQRKFLLSMFRRLPSQSPLYRQFPDEYPDNVAKFLYMGDGPVAGLPEGLVITNKMGQAYGFLSDIAHFRDEKAGIEFLLSAVVYVNDNQIFNDGVYEYERVGLPFLGALGRFVYAFEKSRVTE